ncbi:DUF3987 domain-containing protein [Hymenobacter sp. BRD67]|nr:DUF3987 domain-containing protein [Hymenobacter sp. BRD67]
MNHFFKLTDLLDDEPVAESSPEAQQPRESSHQGQPDPHGALTWCLNIFSGGPFPPPGGRNTWLATFALFCNERGVPLPDLLSHCLGYYAEPGFDAKEIETTVRGIYTRDAAKHGSKPYTTTRAKESAPDAPIPADLYDVLPDYLRRCCEPFEGHEKAVMLLSALTVLSGCFPGVGGTYAQREFGLNLFLFILAQAASGKGSAAYAYQLARGWHKHLTAESAGAEAEYEAEVAAQKGVNKGKGSNSYTPPPPRAGKCFTSPAIPQERQYCPS